MAKNLNSKIGLREIVLLVVIIAIYKEQFQRIFPSLGRELMYIKARVVNFPNYSYDDKMREKVGVDYYNWTQFVRKYTSKNSFVMHPPQMWPWGQSGNPEFSQYFLYPAKLIREDRGSLYTKNLTHVLIAWGESSSDPRLFGWPKFPVFAQKIYYLPQRRKIEIKELEDLQGGEKEADRIINKKEKDSLDLTYTSSLYDYWLRSVKLNLSPALVLKVEIKSNWLNSVAMVAKVSFGNGRTAIFSSAPNQKVDEWETLILKDLYQRATQFARLQGWGSGGIKIEAIGLDTGHPAKMPYLEKWGLIEMEKGGEERLDYLSRQPVNSQTLLSLADIYFLDGETVKAQNFYQKASLLEAENPWAHYGVAESALKLGNEIVAEAEYTKARDLAENIPWFYHALGEFYLSKGNSSKAIEEFQKSLELDPGGFWTNRAIGDAYKAQKDQELAYRYYKLASIGAARAFTWDGKVAWEGLLEIEKEKSKEIENYLEEIKTDPKRWDLRIELGKIYTLLGKADDAKEQFQIAYQINPEEAVVNEDLDPRVIDRIGQSFYGTKGPALETNLGVKEPVAILDNYHSYIKYSKDFFPTKKGTIEILWRPPGDFENQGISRTLIYQLRGIFVRFVNSKFTFYLFDKNNNEWKKTESSRVSLQKEKWYSIKISYGPKGMYLFLDNERMIFNDFKDGLNEKTEIYLGKGPIWTDFESVIPAGYFDIIRIYGYQKI